VHSDRIRHARVQPRDQTVAERETAHERREHDARAPDTVAQRETREAEPQSLERQPGDAGHEEDRDQGARHSDSSWTAALGQTRPFCPVPPGEPRTQFTPAIYEPGAGL